MLYEDKVIAVPCVQAQRQAVKPGPVHYIISGTLPEAPISKERFVFLT